MSDKPYVFIDLDGPILDISGRYYQAYRTIITRLGGRPIKKNKYLDLKREKYGIPEILGLSGISAGKNTSLFNDHWLKIIEKKTFLAFDKLWPYTNCHLEYLKDRYGLVLVTLRRSKLNLGWQLSRLKLKSRFDLVLCENANKGSWEVKCNLMKKGRLLEKACALIGDTEIDILAGKKLGIKTIALTCGVRSGNILAEYKPDCILSSLAEIKKVL